MNGHDSLDLLLGIDDADGYGALRDALIDADDDLLEKLVSLRRMSGLTQSEVAERMNRSKTAVSNFERLGNDPRLSTVRRYAAAVRALISHSVVDYDAWKCSGDMDLTDDFEVHVRKGVKRSVKDGNKIEISWGPTVSFNSEDLADV